MYCILNSFFLRFVLPTTRLDFSNVSSIPFVSLSWHTATFKIMKFFSPNELTSFNLYLSELVTWQNSVLISNTLLVTFTIFKAKWFKINVKPNQVCSNIFKAILK